jgi:hypothetical protein
LAESANTYTHMWYSAGMGQHSVCACPACLTAAAVQQSPGSAPALHNRTAQPHTSAETQRWGLELVATSHPSLDPILAAEQQQQQPQRPASRPKPCGQNYTCTGLAAEACLSVVAAAGFCWAALMFPCMAPTLPLVARGVAKRPASHSSDTYCQLQLVVSVYCLAPAEPSSSNHRQATLGSQACACVVRTHGLGLLAGYGCCC